MYVMIGQGRVHPKTSAENFEQKQGKRQIRCVFVPPSLSVAPPHPKEYVNHSSAGTHNKHNIQALTHWMVSFGIFY